MFHVQPSEPPEPGRAVRHRRRLLGDFSECFLTGSAAEVTPVGQVGDHRFTPGELSLSLMDDYGKLVRGQL